MDNNSRSFGIACLESLLISDVDPTATGSRIRQRLLSNSNPIQSGGPWLVVDRDQAVFDGVNAGCGLGYNSGPLFGTVQFAGAWSNDWNDPDVQAVQTAYHSFVERKPRWNDRAIEVNTPSQLIRAYISSNILEQFEIAAEELTSKMQVALTDAASKFLQAQAGEFLSVTTVANRRVVCHFPDLPISPLIQLLGNGILAESLGSRSAAIELPLAATSEDLKLLAERLIASWSGKISSQQRVSLRDYGHYYRFHSQLLDYKQQTASGSSISNLQALEYLRELLPPEICDVAQLHFVTRENWPRFREAVVDLQKAIYEPVRQTSATTFDLLFHDDFGYGLLVLVDGEIAGMASAGPLSLFPTERGTLADECRNDRHVLYPLDLTVSEQYRGALGTYLKRGMALIGLAAGHRAFHGRNRDRLAAAMWAINLSLGSYQIRHLPNDYPDSHQYRDCIYYRCPLRWSKPIGALQSATGQELEHAIARLLYF